MKIIEEFQMPAAEWKLSEDMLYADANFAAVIDGATPKGHRLWRGRSSGRMAAETLCGVLEGLSPGAAVEDFVAACNAAFRKVYREHGCERSVYLEPCERITASVAVYSCRRREIWLVGDCRFAVNGVNYDNVKSIDRVLGQIRADINKYWLGKGISEDMLRADDRGRKAIGNLLREQCFFQNRTDGSEFDYCVVDGFTPERISCRPTAQLPVCMKIPAGSELVLATDGYPAVKRTLAESEKMLAQSLREDPLCIFGNVQTKGVAPGAESFDDRTYMRLCT